MDDSQSVVQPTLTGLRLIQDDGKIDFSGFLERQKRFIFTNDYMIADWGGLGSGKTSEACALALLLSVTIPKNKWWICRLTGDKLEQSTMKEFFSLMGCTAKNAIQHPLVKNWNQTKRELVFQNGSEVKFVSLEAEDAARGPNLGGYLIDQVEEISEITFMDLDARCRLKENGINEKVWRALIIGNPCPGWCKRTFKDRAGSIKNFTFFESTTKDLSRIVGTDYLERLLQNRPQWWIDRFVWGKWGSAEGAVFHKFKREDNTISRKKFNSIFKQTWPVIAAYDHGSNSSHPCAILYQTWDPEKPDVFYVFSGAKENQNVDDFAKTIKELEAQFPANPLLKRVADIDTFGQRGVGTPSAAYLTHGIGLIKCRKKPNYLTEAIAGLNTVFAERKIFIVDDLLGVLDEFEGWEYKPKPNGLLDSAPATINDDYCKAMLYLFLENRVDFEDDLRLSSFNRVDYSEEILYQAMSDASIDPITGW